MKSLIPSIFLILAFLLLGLISARAEEGPLTLLKFEADWCAPCQQMKPNVRKVSAAFGSKISVQSINIDNNQALADKYRVKGIPHIVAIKNGKVVGKVTGYQSEAALTRFVNRKL